MYVCVSWPRGEAGWGGGWGERGVGMREKHSIRKNDEGGYAGKKGEKGIFLKYVYALLGKRDVSLMLYFTFFVAGNAGNWRMYCPLHRRGKTH